MLFLQLECSYISTESLSVQETAESSYSPHSPQSWERLFAPPHDPASYSQESERSLDPDSPFISEAECRLALAGLRNNVSQAECSFAPAFAKQMVRDLNAREEKEDREEELEESDTNEGILFKEVHLKKKKSLAWPVKWSLMFHTEKEQPTSTHCEHKYERSLRHNYTLDCTVK